MILSDGCVSLLFRREFDRSYESWSRSRAESAELSGQDLYVLIARLLANADDLDPVQASEVTTLSIASYD
jgi:hypothetical protein